MSAYPPNPPAPYGAGPPAPPGPYNQAGGPPPPSQGQPPPGTTPNRPPVQPGPYSNSNSYPVQWSQPGQPPQPQRPPSGWQPGPPPPPPPGHPQYHRPPPPGGPSHPQQGPPPPGQYAPQGAPPPPGPIYPHQRPPSTMLPSQQPPAQRPMSTYNSNAHPQPPGSEQTPTSPVQQQQPYGAFPPAPGPLNDQGRPMSVHVPPNQGQLAGPPGAQTRPATTAPQNQQQRQQYGPPPNQGPPNWQTRPDPSNSTQQYPQPPPNQYQYQQPDPRQSGLPPGSQPQQQHQPQQFAQQQANVPGTTGSPAPPHPLSRPGSTAQGSPIQTGRYTPQQQQLPHHPPEPQLNQQYGRRPSQPQGPGVPASHAQYNQTSHSAQQTAGAPTPPPIPAGYVTEVSQNTVGQPPHPIYSNQPPTHRYDPGTQQPAYGAHPHGHQQQPSQGDAQQPSYAQGSNDPQNYSGQPNTESSHYPPQGQQATAPQGGWGAPPLVQHNAPPLDPSSQQQNTNPGQLPPTNWQQPQGPPPSSSGKKFKYTAPGAPEQPAPIAPPNIPSHQQYSNQQVPPHQQQPPALNASQHFQPVQESQQGHQNQNTQQWNYSGPQAQQAAPLHEYQAPQHQQQPAPVYPAPTEQQYGSPVPAPSQWQPAPSANTQQPPLSQQSTVVGRGQNDHQTFNQSSQSVQTKWQSGGQPNPPLQAQQWNEGHAQTQSTGAYASHNVPLPQRKDTLESTLNAMSPQPIRPSTFGPATTSSAMQREPNQRAQVSSIDTQTHGNNTKDPQENSKKDQNEPYTPTMTPSVLGASALGGALGPSDWEHFNAYEDDIDDTETFGAKKEPIKAVQGSNALNPTAELPAVSTTPPPQPSPEPTNKFGPGPIQPNASWTSVNQANAPPSTIDSLDRNATPPQSHFSPTPPPKDDSLFSPPQRQTPNIVSTGSSRPPSQALARFDQMKPSVTPSVVSEVTEPEQIPPQNVPIGAPIAPNTAPSVVSEVHSDKQNALEPSQSFVMDDGGWSSQPAVTDSRDTFHPVSRSMSQQPATTALSGSQTVADSGILNDRSNPGGEVSVQPLIASDSTASNNQSEPFIQPLNIKKSHENIEANNTAAHTVSNRSSYVPEPKVIRIVLMDRSIQTDPVVTPEPEPPVPVDPYAFLEPYAKESLSRFADVLRKESEATSTEDKTKIFTDFLKTESRWRGIEYEPHAPKAPAQTESVPTISTQVDTPPVIEEGQFSPGGRPLKKGSKTTPEVDSGSFPSETKPASSSGDDRGYEGSSQHVQPGFVVGSEDLPRSFDEQQQHHHQIGTPPVHDKDKPPMRPLPSPEGQYKAYTPPVNPISQQKEPGSPEYPDFEKSSKHEPDLPHFALTETKGAESKDQSGNIKRKESEPKTPKEDPSHSSRRREHDETFIMGPAPPNSLFGQSAEHSVDDEEEESSEADREVQSPNDHEEAPFVETPTKEVVNLATESREQLHTPDTDESSRNQKLQSSPSRSTHPSLAGTLPKKGTGSTDSKQALDSLRSVLELESDNFDFIKTNIADWDTMAKDNREKNEKERRIRQEQEEEQTERLFEEGKIPYSDISRLEEDFKKSETDLKAKEDNAEYASYTSQVFDPTYKRLQDSIVAIMGQEEACFHNLSSALAGKAALEPHSPPQLPLVDLLRTFVDLHEKVELRHSRVLDTILDRNKRYKRTVIQPLYVAGNITKMKAMERHFDESEKRAALDAARDKLARAKRLMDTVDDGVRRGVGQNLDYMEQLTQILHQTEDFVNGLTDGLSDDPQALLADIKATETAMERLTASSHSMMRSFHSAALAVNAATHEVEVVSAKLSNADATEMDRLSKAKEAEEGRLNEDLAHRMQVVSADFDSAREHILKLLPTVEKLKQRERVPEFAIQAPTPVPKVQDPEHEERIRKALEAARRRNQAAEDFS